MTNDGPMAEMPKYKCHKVVHALPIRQVFDPTKPGEESDGSRMLVFDSDTFLPRRVSREYVRKHNPQPGGYFVVYDDGYESWSPKEAFESGYSLIE